MESSAFEEILVLGASGFLGQSLVFSLNRGTILRCHGASRSPSPATSHIIPSYERETIEELIESLNPRTIINCVGMVGHQLVDLHPQAANEINVRLPALLGELTAKRQIGLIHFSSDSVYSGDPDLAPFSEDDEPLPFSLYGLQKLESERVVQAHNPRALVLRVNFFGWSREGQTGVLDHFLSHALRGTKPLGYSRYFVTSLYIGDLADIVERAITAELRGVYNLGSADSQSKFDFGRAVLSNAGFDESSVVPATPSIWAVEKVSTRDLSMISTRIERSLEIQVPRQEQGINRALSELREHLQFFITSHFDTRLPLLSDRGR